MASGPSVASKLSDVLEVLSKEADETFPRFSVGPVYSLEVEHNKQVFTDAVHYCMVLLQKSNKLMNNKSEVLSLEATLMGHEMFERIISINVQMDVETEEEAFAYSEQHQEVTVQEDESVQQNESVQEDEPVQQNKTVQQDEPVHNNKDEPVKQVLVKQEPETVDLDESFINMEDYLETTIQQENNEQDSPNSIRAGEQQQQQQPEGDTTIFGRMVVDIPSDIMADFLSHSATHYSDDQHLPPSPLSLPSSEDGAKKPRPKRYHKNPVPFEIKEQVVNLMRLNPNWTIRWLRNEINVPSLRSIKQARVWERQVNEGGSRRDKFRKIGHLTYERLTQAQERSQPIHTDIIREWAVQAAKDVFGLNFKFEPKDSWIQSFRKQYNLTWDFSTYDYCPKNDKKTTSIERLALKRRKSLRLNGHISPDPPE